MDVDKSLKLVYGIIACQVGFLTVIKQVSIKPYFWSDTMHMMLEMGYVFSLLSNPEVYYLLHCLQVCFRIGVAPPMIGVHIIEKQFLAMWKMEDWELVEGIFGIHH